MFQMPFTPVFDDPPAGGTPPPTTTPPAPKLIPQDEVNKIVEQRLAEERKKFGKKEAELVSKLEQLDLTSKQKEQVEAQLEELRQSTMTKEQLAAEASEKERKAHEKELKKAAEERDNWRKTYIEEKIDRELLTAASDKGEEGKEEAFNPDQIVQLLKARTRVADEIGENGKPTGKLNTKIKFDTVDKEGKPVTLDLTPAETLKAMREDKKRFGNLFKSGAVGGLGGTTQRPSTGGSSGIEDMSMDDLYKRYRENPASLGIRRT